MRAGNNTLVLIGKPATSGFVILVTVTLLLLLLPSSLQAAEIEADDDVSRSALHPIYDICSV